MRVAILLLALGAGCGSPAQPHDPWVPRSPMSADRSESSSDCREPDADYYLHLLREPAHGFRLQEQLTQVLWINFGGATVQRGFGRDRSFIVCQDTASLPAPNLPADTQSRIRDAVQEHFFNSRVRINTVLERPESGDYTTIHVTNSLADLGCTNTPSIAGVAPYDPGNLNPNDLGFAFAGLFSSSVHGLAAVVAHEAAHSFGLNHIDNRSAVMHPAYSPGVTGFAAGPVYDNPSQTQDSVALLRDTLGELIETPEPQEEEADDVEDELEIEEFYVEGLFDDNDDDAIGTRYKEPPSIGTDDRSHGDCGPSDIDTDGDSIDAICSVLRRKLETGGLDELPDECRY